MTSILVFGYLFIGSFLIVTLYVPFLQEGYEGYEPY